MTETPTGSDTGSGRPWAWGIAIAYGVFAVLTLVMVGFAYSMRVDLVSEDYYHREITHQDHIDRVARTQALPEGVEWTITHEGEQLLFHLPVSHFEGSLQGQILLYRPDNSTLDRTYGIDLDGEGLQRIASDDLPAGHWRIRIEWEADGVGYFSERELNVGA